MSDEYHEHAQYAGILAQAATTLGSLQAAEAWMKQPALGLGGKRPVDLLCTKSGADMVAALLTRMEYGVYT